MKRLLLFLAMLATAGAYGQESEVSGRVRVTGRTAGAAVPTIVYAERLDNPAPKRALRVRMAQQAKAFVPRMLALPAGSKVDFPNEDSIYHNIFSLSPPDPFDLGLYSAGASKSRTFEKPGAYQVFCNIHPQMTAVIVVAPTPYIAEVDATGSYKLALQRGRYRLTAWSERAKPASVEFTVGAGDAAPELALDESDYVELPHKNKYGREYPVIPVPPAKKQP